MEKQEQETKGLEQALTVLRVDLLNCINHDRARIRSTIKLTTALEEGMNKQVLETEGLAKALTQQGINLTVIRDNDALEAFKTLHVAQKLEKQVAESKLEIKMLQNFTGLHKHYAMLHEQEQQQLQKPLPPKPVQTTTRPAFHPGHHQKKSWFNRTASSALRVQGPSEDF